MHVKNPYHCLEQVSELFDTLTLRDKIYQLLDVLRHKVDYVLSCCA